MQPSTIRLPTLLLMTSIRILAEEPVFLSNVNQRSVLLVPVMINIEFEVLSLRIIL
jgi:hypothetical protein